MSFRADRVHFVLVTHRQHLLLSVQRRYGFGEGADEYIQKFYDFLIHFESVSEDHTGPHSRRYAERLLSQMLPAEVPHVDRRNIEGALKGMATAFDLTLRQTESIVTNVVLAFLSVEQRTFRPVTVICFLAALKALRPDLYLSAKRGKFDIEGFQAFVDGGDWPSDFNGASIIDWFRYFGDPNINVNDERYSRFWQGLAQYSFRDRLSILPFLANVYVDQFART